MAESKRLYGLKSIVTGGASSIGEAIVRTFAKHGAEVIAADSADSHIDSIYKRVQGVHPLIVQQDPPPMAAKLTQYALDALGGLDILVNHFPAISDASAPAARSEDRSRLQQNQHQLILDTSRAVLPLLKQSPAGRIINIGCLPSSFGASGKAEFAASRIALAQLTATQAAEYGVFGITANFVQPGAIMTAASREIFDADKEFRDQCIKGSAARRLGEPVDVAKVVLFLATDDAVFVSGTGIVVDGGVMSGSESV
jgi:NAD(P)-dependent dehydrogenase (short-subunit alcohol dehydrogenase family)